MSIQIDNGDFTRIHNEILEGLATGVSMSYRGDRTSEWWDDFRASLRYQGETARTKKKLIKKRGEMCQHCGRGVAAGQIERLHAHHLIHKRQGGSNDPSNLILLCRACHELEHTHGVGR